MTEKNYELEDIKDYLYEEYELVWMDFEIDDEDVTRKVKDYDFFGDSLNVMAILYKDGRALDKPLHVSNQSLQVGGHPKETDDWQDFVNSRKNKNLIV